MEWHFFFQTHNIRVKLPLSQCHQGKIWNRMSGEVQNCMETLACAFRLNSLFVDSFGLILPFLDFRSSKFAFDLFWTGMLFAELKTPTFD